MSFRHTAIAAALVLGLLATSAVEAEIGLGTDVVSRYVWRGTDFGDAVSVQPFISYTSGPIEVGTWASYPIGAADGANEHDLYVTYSVMEALSVTLTDYYFPQGGMFLEFEDDKGAHSFEISAGYVTGPVSVTAGFFFWNDANSKDQTDADGNPETVAFDEEDALYVEFGYDLGEVSDGVNAGLFAAVGNGQYADAEDSAIKFVNAGLSLSSDDYSASYIINPESETTFLVLGKSF